MRAHECLVKSSELLDALGTLRSESSCSKGECQGCQQSFIELGRLVPDLEVTLNLRLRDPHHTQNDSEGWISFFQTYLDSFLNLHVIQGAFG